MYTYNIKDYVKGIGVLLFKYIVYKYTVYIYVYCIWLERKRERDMKGVKKREKRERE